MHGKFVNIFKIVSSLMFSHLKTETEAMNSQIFILNLKGTNANDNS